MTREEIQPYLDVGNSHSVCVDRSLVQGLPNVMRYVEISKPYDVNIKFYNHALGLFESPLLHSNRIFASLDEVIIYLEQYFGRSIETWENFNRTGNYPIRTEGEPVMSGYDTWKELRILLEQLVPQGFSIFR